jgi:hypothetical protein
MAWATLVASPIVFGSYVAAEPRWNEMDRRKTPKAGDAARRIEATAQAIGGSVRNVTRVVAWLLSRVRGFVTYRLCTLRCGRMFLLTLRFVTTRWTLLTRGSCRMYLWVGMTLVWAGMTLARGSCRSCGVRLRGCRVARAPVTILPTLIAVGLLRPAQSKGSFRIAVLIAVLGRPIHAR